MCGRYTYYEPTDNLATRYKLSKAPKQIPFNFNVAPGQVMPVIIMENGKPELDFMQWGLIPVWSKDPRIGYKLINARGETIFEKPVWKRLVLHKRALIPANGFYEWLKPQTPKDHKQPFYIHPKEQELFSFAGVYDTWHDPSGNELRTYSIITTEPNREMSKIHDRMPVILHQDEEAEWLDPTKDTKDVIEKFIHPYEDNGLDTHKVSEAVNSPRNNDKHLLQAIKT